MYPIDPSREIGHQSKFKVYCDFENGQSIVHHSKEKTTQIETCSGANCFTLPIEYSVKEMENIRKLVEVSDSCHQDITFNCFFAKITGHASFTSWDDKFQAHFQDNNTTKCLCSNITTAIPRYLQTWSWGPRETTKTENKCVKKQGEIFCNCDIGDKESRQDVIRIDNKVNSSLI